MKKATYIVLIGTIVACLFNVFGTEDALIQFIVLGRLPGVDHVLNILEVLPLLLICIFAIGAWVRQFSFELAVHSARNLQPSQSSLSSDAFAPRKVSTSEHTNEELPVAPSIEIDELDLISL